MTFDKPDLGFVIHFQEACFCSSLLINRLAVLVVPSKKHSEFFFVVKRMTILQTFSSVVLSLLNSILRLFLMHLRMRMMVYLYQSMQQNINIGQSQIDKTIKYLTLESPSPAAKVGSKWHVTASAANWQIDQE